MAEAKEQPKKKTDAELAQEFAKEYADLCEKHGYRVNVTPAMTARDDGTWSFVLQTGVAKLPQN